MSNLGLKNWKFKADLPRFTSRKTAKNNDGHKRPLNVAEIQESFQKIIYQKPAISILGTQIWKKNES